MKVKWVKCGKDQHWCDLMALDLSKFPESTLGVYVMWVGGTHSGPTMILDVGQGVIAERLRSHRNREEFKDRAESVTIRVTWAEEKKKKTRRGMERHLAEKYDLLDVDGLRFPDVDPIPVNLPV